MTALRIVSCALLAMLALPEASGAKSKPKPPGAKPPTSYVGTIKAREIRRDGQPNGGPTTESVTRWRVDNLKLKRGRVKFLGNGWKVPYKVVAGSYTWERELSDNYPKDPICAHNTEEFKYTLSLKGRRWDSDSRITFYANSKGRLKNRWFVSGALGSPIPNFERSLGCPPELGSNNSESAPPLFNGLKVGQRLFRAPGKKVKMVSTVHSDSPTTDGGSFFQDKRETLRIRPR
jgi:hypothetical protein